MVVIRYCRLFYILNFDHPVTGFPQRTTTRKKKQFSKGHWARPVCNKPNECRTTVHQPLDKTKGAKVRNETQDVDYDMAIKPKMPCEQRKNVCTIEEAVNEL